MKNRDIFTKDPQSLVLLNDGVAKVTSELNDDELKKLQFELETFVCEGQYDKGLDRILRSYLINLKKPEQPAAWVSGFYGSGKSHLVKMLQYLWTDLPFPDGETARSKAHLSEDIKEQLKALSTEGKRAGGLHAAAGTLDSAITDVRLALLSIIFKSAGLPSDFPKARFVMWLKNEGIFEDVKARVEKAKKNFITELSYMYVSETLANAILAAKKTFASNVAEVGAALRSQFPHSPEITDEVMHESIVQAIGNAGTLPCTLIVLDEIQQYIGESDGASERAYKVQEVVESCSKRFGARILFAATGQSALSGMPHLQRLMARFTVTIHLADTDVETVIRKMVLEKKADKAEAVKAELTKCDGEISRHLSNSKIAARADDKKFLVADYPLLPIRRRFWELVLRQVDRAGTTAQLRTQLKIVYEAVRATADQPVGTVVAGDFIFDQIDAVMVQSGVLLREIHELIKKQDDKTPAGKLRSRLCALMFLIGKMPHEDSASDLGIRSTPDTLADLLITDLKAGSGELRKQIPEQLKVLEKNGHVMPVGDEYRIQTREGSEWDNDYRGRFAKIQNDDNRIAAERADQLRINCDQLLKEVKLTHGKSKVHRKVELHFTPDAPKVEGQAIPVWVRNAWNDDEKSVLADCRKQGTDSPLITVFVQRRQSEELKKALASFKAAEETLNARGQPSTAEGIEARAAMETRKNQADGDLKAAINEILDGIRVFMAGGTEKTAITPVQALTDAAQDALARHFPQFHLADDPKWESVLDQAKKGNPTALEYLGFKGNVSDNPVCKAVLDFVGSGKKGSEVRRNFASSPYGWGQDAIDAALLTLFVNNLIRASQNGIALDRKQLDQTKIGVADFRAETQIISAQQRIAIRKLFQNAGVSFKQGEEAAAAPVYCAELLSRAKAAGGDEPLPAIPATGPILAIQRLSGNDQLFELCNHKDELERDAQEWKKREEAIAQRLPKWQALQRLLSHATALPVSAEIQPQIAAIKTNRSLLVDPDPVPGLIKKLSDELRKALVASRAAYEKAYDAQRDALDATRWKELGAEIQDNLLAREELDKVPALAVGTGDELVHALEQCSPDDWKTRTDALPTRFQKVQLAVAKTFEPDAVRVQLPHATVSNEKEVDVWLAAAKDEILKALKKGPVVIS